MKQKLAFNSQLPALGAASEGTGHASSGLRRFPPVLQFITRSSPYLEREMRARSLECFRRGGTIEHICTTIYRTALDAGFHATIGIQEVTSRAMPSFPGETVLSALLIVDLQYDPDLSLTTRAASAVTQPPPAQPT